MALSDELAIEKLVKYLQIPTVQPDPDYSKSTIFLKNYATELGLPFKVIEPHPGKPIVVITWTGSDPTRSGSIMLNSHVDVVPVEKEHWLYPPFEARQVDGRIVARGAQDDKVLGIIHLEAVRRLKATGFTPKRTVHVTFVPDEEIGGFLGMKLFVESKEFREMNVVFALDEGSPSIDDNLPVFYGERVAWWLQVTCRGGSGHGSMLKRDTAGEKLWRFVDKLMRFRQSQRDLLELTHPGSVPQFVGNTLSVNLTMLEGGKQPNVIPSELSATFDMRIPPTVDLKRLDKKLATLGREAAEESGGDASSVTFDFREKEMCQATCDVTSEQVAPFWSAMRDAIESFSLKPQLQICFAATDCRYLRAIGIPGLGFSPLPFTKELLIHGHNEYIDEAVFLKGIEIFQEIIRQTSNV